MKFENINVQFRGGFKGGYVPVQCLIDNKIIIDVLNFARERSQVRDCEMYCRMQIQIGGKLHVTWQASEILTQYMEDCRAQDVNEGTQNFPIEECIIYVGEDRGYYFGPPDAESVIPTEKELEKMMRRYNNRKR